MPTCARGRNWLSGDSFAWNFASTTIPRNGRHPTIWLTRLRDEGVLETFQSLARGKRNHIVQWLERAARDTTRANRITRIVEVALGEREKKLDRESRGGTKRR